MNMRLVYTYAHVFNVTGRTVARNRSTPFEDIVHIVAKLPWWVGVALAIVFYLWMHHVATQVSPPTTDLKQMGAFVGGEIWRTLATFLQYVLPAGCLIGAGISAYQRFSNGTPQLHSNPDEVPAQSGRPGTVRSQSSMGSASIPDCPACGSPMVKRTSKKGANAGEAFWGCTQYPKCRGTKAIT